MAKKIIVGLSGITISILFIIIYFNVFKPVSTCTTTRIIGGQANIGGPFELLNQHGEVIRDTDLINGPVLIYFGYSFCPDICPLDVVRNLEVSDILNDKNINVTPVFITIDPERDTVPVLADYADAMHPRLIALTGSVEQIKHVADLYRIYYSKAVENKDDDYLMDHSTYTYFMNERGFLDVFRRSETPQEIVEKISCLIEN